MWLPINPAPPVTSTQVSEGAFASRALDMRGLLSCWTLIVQRGILAFSIVPISTSLWGSVFLKRQATTDSFMRVGGQLGVGSRGVLMGEPQWR